MEDLWRASQGRSWRDVESYLRSCKREWGGHWDISLFAPGGTVEGSGLYVVSSRRDIRHSDRYERWTGEGQFIRYGSGKLLPVLVLEMLERVGERCRAAQELAERQSFF